VTAEDELPKIMCGECSYKLELFGFFIDKAFKTESQLLAKLHADKVKAEVYNLVFAFMNT
jgi:hypothetical protein